MAKCQWQFARRVVYYGHICPIVAGLFLLRSPSCIVDLRLSKPDGMFSVEVISTGARITAGFDIPDILLLVLIQLLGGLQSRKG